MLCQKDSGTKLKKLFISPDSTKRRVTTTIMGIKGFITRISMYMSVEKLGKKPQNHTTVVFSLKLGAWFERLEFYRSLRSCQFTYYVLEVGAHRQVCEEIESGHSKLLRIMTSTCNFQIFPKPLSLTWFCHIGKVILGNVVSRLRGCGKLFQINAGSQCQYCSNMENLNINKDNCNWLKYIK